MSPSESELLKQNEDLRQALAQAEAANQAKGDYLANLSHEIRTPLNTIFGLSRQLIETCSDDIRAPVLRKINSASRLLLGILNHVLDYSKIEAGKLQIDSHDFQLADVVEQMEDMFVSAAQDKGLDMAFRVSPDVPPALCGDSLRLSQVLGNLLANAIKFTEQGRVELLISRIGGNEDRARLRFEVQDTGIGLSQDQMQSLFHDFAQAEVSTPRKYGGTGLGLSISHKLVEFMGGTLQVNSALGKGSTFFFELDFSLASALPGAQLTTSSSSQETAIPSFVGSSILLVEDNLMNQEIATWWLGRTGANTTIASNGLEAVQMASSTPFDLILMDLQMPEMDGYSAARHIRSFLPDIPMIALSAASMEHDRQASRQAGMNDHLTKPIEEAKLYRVLSKWLKNSDTAAPVLPISSPTIVLPTSLEGFDLQRGLRLADGNAYFYLQTLHRFREQLQTEFFSLTPNLKNLHAPQATARQAHTLKGIASTVGAQPLTDAATAIDRAFKQGAPIGDSLCAALEQALTSALTQLKTLPPLPSSASKPTPHLGEQSLPALLRVLHSQDLVEDSLLSSVEAFLETRLGKEPASRLRKYVETFNYQGAIALLSPLENHPGKFSP